MGSLEPSATTPSDGGEPALLDVDAAWRGLPAEVQQRLGMAAIVQGLASWQGFGGWADAASMEARTAIEEAVRDHVGDPDGDGPPPRPDLACLGVQACRECGCTDDHACAEGCEWVEQDLCSTCAEKGDAA